jgi:hypothetical protein
MTEPKQMSERFKDRNYRIWKARCEGVPAREIAEAFHLTEASIYNILAQCKREFPPEEQTMIKEFRAEIAEQMKRMVVDVTQKAYQNPPPAFAPNGKPQVDPMTGELVRDMSTFFNGVAAWSKLDERIAKLTGSDAASQQHIHVSHEAVEATKSDADKVGQRFPGLIPESPEVRAHAGK